MSCLYVVIRYGDTNIHMQLKIQGHCADYFSVYFSIILCKKISLRISTEKTNLQSDRSQINKNIKFGNIQINSIFVKQSLKV